MKKILYGAGVLSLALLGGQTTAFAEQFNVTSKIISATVFPQGAQLTREVPVTLTKGKHTVILEDLPTGMLRDSIIVIPPADSGITLKSLDTQYVKIPEDQQIQNADLKQLEGQLEQLQEERSILQMDIKTARTQQTYINKLTNIPSEQSGKSQPDWTAIFTLISEKTAEINKKIHDTNKKLRDVGEKISLVTSKIKQFAPRKTYQNRVSLHLVAEKDITTNLQFKYQVTPSSVGWQQQYEAHLSTSEGINKARLKIIRNASIKQRTGENWDNVKVTLSTTVPTQGTSAPDMKPLRLVLKNDKQAIPRKKAYNRQNVIRQYSLQNNAPASVTARFDGGQPADGASPQKQLTFHTLYNVPEAVTLIANGNSKQIPMGEFDVKPSLRAITVPRLKKLAYLSAKFKMPKEVNSSKGTTFIYRDGTYVGKGHLPNLTAGAEYNLGFGVDNQIQVKHVEINRSKEQQSGILSSTRSDERHYQMTIKNFHNWKIPVTVMDRYPFAYDKEIQISLYPSTTKPTKKNVEDKRGVLSWDREIAAGAEEKIQLSYKVSWPADKNIDIGRVFLNNEAQFRFNNRLKY